MVVLDEWTGEKWTDNTEGSLEVSGHELRGKAVSLIFCFSPPMFGHVRACRSRVGHVDLSRVRSSQVTLRK